MNDVLAALAPTLLLGGAALLVLPHVSIENVLARRICAYGTAVLLIRYLIWRTTSTLPPFDGGVGSWAAYGYFGIDFVNTLDGLVILHMLSRYSNRTAEVDAHPVESHPGGPPLIDLFIPTYNEKQEILMRTIVGALAQDYPRFRVWVLDDGRRDWLRELAGSLGAGYLTRKDNLHGKAGNMNAGLAHVLALRQQPDVIAILDADFIATPRFLARAAALLHDPKTALVQTPQHFFNPDPIQLNLGAARVIPDEQRFFFDTILPAKDAHGTAFSCGTSGMVRVRALREVGGFPTESVTEDMLLSIKLAALGYRTAYLNERLTVGLAPEGMHEYLTQRGRWCLGSMQIARTAWGPFARGKVPFLMRLHSLDTILFWAIGPLARICSFLVPILYWWGGVYVMRTDTPSLCANLIPYWLASSVFLGWVSRGTVLPMFIEAISLLTMFESLKASAIGLFGSKNQKFKVTAKGMSRDRVVIHWSLMRWFVGCAVLTLGGVAYRTITGPIGGAPLQVEGVNFFWSIYNIATLMLACLMCIELPRFRSEERFPADEPAQIFFAGRRHAAVLRDISVAGAGLAVADGEMLPNGASVRVHMREIGAIPAVVVRGQPGTCHVRFDDESLRPALVRKIFAGNHVPTITRLPLLDLVGVVARRAFG